MQFEARIIPKVLHFKRPAGTSRGAYTTRKVWYVLLTDQAETRIGIGECAPLPNLSCDDVPQYEEMLSKACRSLEEKGEINYQEFLDFPSIIFGLETALLHIYKNSFQLYDTPFGRGEQAIPINGLIWMGDFDYMRQQIDEKLRQGFRCVKLKIGAIDFDQELSLLSSIRKHYGADQTS